MGLLKSILFVGALGSFFGCTTKKMNATKLIRPILSESFKSELTVTSSQPTFSKTK